MFHVRHVLLPLFSVFVPLGPIPVLVSLVWSCSGLCQSPRVSSWCLPVLPGLIREEDRKKKKLRKVTLFETKTVTCHAGGNSPQNSSEGESSVPLGPRRTGDRTYRDWRSPQKLLARRTIPPFLLLTSSFPLFSSYLSSLVFLSSFVWVFFKSPPVSF